LNYYDRKVSKVNEKQFLKERDLSKKHTKKL